MDQTTLGSTVEARGIGLHSGREVLMRLKPASADTGVVFVRADLPDAPRVPVRPEFIVEMPMRTVLARGGTRVETTEHLLSALMGLGVDNVEVELDGPEVPGMDGSALPFCSLIREAGIRLQDGKRRGIHLPSSVSVLFGDHSVVAVPSEGGMTVSYTLTSTNPHLEPCQFTYRLDSATYEREIAPARTWVLQDEVPKALEAGLGKGASRENTIVVGPEGTDRKALRFPDEFVRHKILDLIGDLAVLGATLHAHVITSRTGHRANGMLARKIQDLVSASPGAEDEVERNEGGVLDARDIQRIIPHRYPFLLVDRVIELQGSQRAVGIKNVSFNEPYFQGHFPGQPVMPGVLQIEAMAQLAGVLLLRNAEHKDRLAYLLGIDNAKFRRAVVPGDQLVLEAETLKVKSRTGEVAVKARVGGKVVSEAIIRFMLVDPR